MVEKTAARYDRVAEFYEATFPDAFEDGPSVAVLELVGDVAGERVLDLACGQGRFSRELARRGGVVVGVDLSQEMLARAVAREAQSPAGIRYLLADAAARSTLVEEAFDLVVCHFGLSDIDDLDGAIAGVARLLRPGGRFVFSIVHPCFPGGNGASGSWPSSGGYYTEGWWQADGELSSLRRRVGANHRTLSTYLNALTRHGLMLDRLLEPLPDDAWAARRPDAARQPLFLVVRAIRR